MNPTFKVGDGLIVEPYENKKIICGDVIAFRRDDKNGNIVHRVIKVGRYGVQTIGDNNNRVDPWILPPADIMGRVVSIKRKRRQFPVGGGLRGRIYGFFIRRYNRLISKVPGILYSLSNIVSGTGIIRKLLPLLRTRIVSFKRPNGTELQIVTGRRIIARRLSGTEQWQIKGLFKLFIDERNLNPEDLCRQKKANR
jgi:hypothetical protein